MTVGAKAYAALGKKPAAATTKPAAAAPKAAAKKPATEELLEVGEEKKEVDDPKYRNDPYKQNGTYSKELAKHDAETKKHDSKVYRDSRGRKRKYDPLNDFSSVKEKALRAQQIAHDIFKIANKPVAKRAEKIRKHAAVERIHKMGKRDAKFQREINKAAADHDAHDMAKLNQQDVRMAQEHKHPKAAVKNNIVSKLRAEDKALEKDPPLPGNIPCNKRKLHPCPPHVQKHKGAMTAGAKAYAALGKKPAAATTKPAAAAAAAPKAAAKKPATEELL